MKQGIFNIPKDCLRYEGVTKYAFSNCALLYLKLMVQYQQQRIMNIEEPLVKTKVHCAVVKDYQTHKLPNGAQVLLMQRPNIPLSYCAVSVGVGSFSDPDEYLGLAHLMEHMIFMGSSKYPIFNEYSSFMSTHSGYDNAETSDTYTNFYFQVATEAFEEALARTCDSLSQPLLTASCVQKQIQAIHEEFILAANDDENRMDEVVKLLGVGTYRRFNMGNLKTLGRAGQRDMLVQFFNQFYSADLMSFVLISPLPLEELSAKCLQHIAAIPNKNLSNHPLFSHYQSPCISLNQFHQSHASQVPIFITKSVKQQTTFKIVWVLPAIDGPQVYKLHIDSYLRYVLCQSKQHSLVSLLQDHQIGTDLVIQFENIGNSQTIMSVEIIDAGGDKDWDLFKMSQAVYSLVMDFMDQHFQSVQLTLLEESKYIRSLSFRQQEIQDMEDYACDLASRMQKRFVPLSDIVSYDVTEAIDPQGAINQFFKLLLNRANTLVTISDPDLPKGTVKVQPYYGTEYILGSMPSHSQNRKIKYQKRKVANSLSPNKLIPLQEQIQILSQTAEPMRIGNIHYFNPLGNEVCRAGIRLFLHNNESFAFKVLFVEFMDLLCESAENVEDAEAIGLDNYFDYQAGTLSMTIFGYDELVLKVLNSLSAQIQKLLELEEAQKDHDLKEIFQEACDNLEDQLDFYFEEEMDDLTDKIRDQILIQPSLPIPSLKKDLQKIKKNKFLQRASKLWEQSIFQWVAVGNLNDQVVKTACRNFELKIKSRSGFKDSTRVAQIKVICLEGQRLKHEIRLQSKDTNVSSCMLYLEAGMFSEQLLAQLQMIENYLEEPFFTELRTQKRLAYDLELKVLNTRGVLGLSFLLVSSRIDPETISENLHAFIQCYLNPDQIMQKMGSEAALFTRLQQSVRIKNFNRARGTIEDLFQFISEEVELRSFGFNRPQEGTVSSVTPLQLSHLAHRLLSKGSAEVLILSRGHKEEYSRKKPKTQTLEKIKESSKYYSDELADLNFTFKK